MDKITEIAKMIDHSLLAPALTDEELKQDCELAKKYNVASVCVKPYAVKLAKECVEGSDVLVSTVVGFPHGNSTIAAKVFETEQAIQDRAVEVDVVVNLGKVLGEDWDYVEREIRAIIDVTKKNNVVLKVIFENDLLPDDKYKIKLCEICSELKVDFVKTSTGYNYVKGPDGKYSYKGATDHDLRLMREHSSPGVQVKAAGGVGSLDAILRVKEMGITRVGTRQTESIINAAREKFEG
jgi:deoxyribose-phosphate aldolase